MKHALLIDLSGALDQLVFLPLRSSEYELTVVSTVSEALALASELAFDLVLLEQSDRCPGFIWSVVDLINRQSLSQALIVIHADQADAEFHARAQEAGTAVLSSPVGVPLVTSPSGREAPDLAAQPVADA